MIVYRTIILNKKFGLLITVYPSITFSFHLLIHLKLHAKMGEKSIFIKKNAQSSRHWVLSHHVSSYAWIIFEWCTLPNSTPRCNSSENLDFLKPSCWVTTSLYMKILLKMISTKFSKEIITHHTYFLFKKFTNKEEKKYYK